MDPRLKHITPREFWGSALFDTTAAALPVITIDNREIVHVVGNRVALFDFGDKKSMILPSANDVSKVLLLCLSNDKRYLAASVQLTDSQEATILIYDMSSHTTGVIQKPRVISNPAATQFTCMCFSNDSNFIACSTDVLSEGILVYDRVRETVTKRVSLPKAVTQISFNPSDDTKLCTTGWV
jgi:WD40 repeat protein